MVADGVQNVRVMFDWSWAQPYQSLSRCRRARSRSSSASGGSRPGSRRSTRSSGWPRSEGLTVLPTVIYAPNWDAAPHPVRRVRDPRAGRAVRQLRERPGPTATVPRAASGRPLAQLPVRMWQIWNEPNIHRFWPKQPFQAAYVALLARRAQGDQASRSGRQGRAGRDAELLLARSSPGSTRSRARGGLFDVVAVHPYTKQPAGRDHDPAAGPQRDERRRRHAQADHRRRDQLALVAWADPTTPARLRHDPGRSGQQSPSSCRCSVATA